VDILDSELLVFGQLEEAAGDVQYGVRQLLRDPMAGQIEETDLMHGVTQLVTE
jgi:hypothetical protein